MGEWVEEDCPGCVDGKCWDCDGRGAYDDGQECPECDSSGRCAECDGSGIVEVEQ